MAKDMQFDILGPVRVWADGGETSVTGRERTLLAMLLLHANQPVAVARLVDAIWEEHQPRDARSRLQGCVSRLRKLLAGTSAPARIVSGPAGYRIEVDEQAVDLQEFRRLLAQARAAAGRDERESARARYRAALALWRGPAVAGVDSEIVRQAAIALDEQRLQAQEEWLATELALGAGGDLVAELTGLVAEHPYRERLHGALMVALYRAGRQADALAAYQRVRTLLVEQVGAEPGTELRALHQRLLTDDPALLATAPAAGPDPGDTAGRPAAESSARHSLPRAVADFTGREEAVARLLDLAHPGSEALTVVAIDGMAGVGKTTLAVHVAHLLAKQYPDAQLYLDLHGHSQRQPVEPAAALEALLRQLGVASGGIPSGLAERAARWRSELAELASRGSSGVLVLLDNAAGTAQVTPLLPAGASCLVLVTSRRRLTGLDAARPVTLDPLSPDEGVALLAELAGERVRAELAAAGEVVGRCGHLPLAIRLAGARLAHRPAWRVRDLAGRLRDARGLLTELAAEDRTVADAFALSYAPLTTDQQRVFRLLGLHPGHELDAYAVAALAGSGLPEARRTLDELVDRHLVDEVRPGRYRLHDLVREYARQLATATDPEPERIAALTRLLDVYLHAAAATTAPMERPGGRSNVQFGEPLRPDLVAAAVAQGPAWLAVERPNLVAAVGLAASTRLNRYAWQLARASWRFFYDRGYSDDLIATQHHGLAAAERQGDAEAVATVLNYLASGYYQIGDYDTAASCLRRTLALRRESGNRAGEAVVLANLSGLAYRLGDLPESTRLHEEALAIRQRLGDANDVASSLSNLGVLYRALGRYDEAVESLHRHLALTRWAGQSTDRVRTLSDLGAVRLRMGRYDAAVRLLTAALTLSRRHGVRAVEGETLSLLGAAYRALGRLDQALARHQEAMVVVQETGDRPLECEARNELGLTLRAAGDVAGALAEHRTALAEATRLRLKYEHARALDGIASCQAATDPAAARESWEQAQRLYREMGLPEPASPPPMMD